MKKVLLFFFISISISQLLAQSIVKTDFLVSQALNQEIYFPSIAVAADGRFGISWGDNRNGINGTGDGDGRIYSQLYQADASKTTNTNSYTDNIVYGTFYDNFSLYRSTCEFLPSGSFIVAWHVGGYTQIGSPNQDIYYSAFNNVGQKIVNGTQINVSGSGGNYPYGKRPQVVVIPPNQFAVVYEFDNLNGYEIGATAVDANTGSVIGGSFLVSDTKTGVRVYPSAASNGSQTVIVWTDGRVDNSGDIYMQRFVNGPAVGSNVKVNDNINTGTYNQWAKVAMGADGKFVVIWLDTRTTNDGDVYAQHFDANGNKIGSNVKLTNSNASLYALMPSIAMYDNDNYVITWTDSLPGKQYTCKTRFFNFGGNPISNVLEISNVGNTSESYNSDVKVGKNGLTYYTWDDRRTTGKGQVYAKILTGFGTQTGIENSNKKEANINCYPNPFDHQIAIVFEEDLSERITLSIYDLLGKKVAEFNEYPIDQIIQLNLDKLSKGLYTLNLKGIGFTNSIKISKN